VLNSVPLELRSAPPQGGATSWVADPVGMRRMCDAAVLRLIAAPAGTPSLRLLTDQTARLLTGLSDVFDGLALLVADPARHPNLHRARLHVPDWLPALVNAGRALVTIVAVEVFWIITAWPNGALAITLQRFRSSSSRRSRCGLRSSDELHGGGRSCCGLRRNCCICGFAECRDLRRLQHCDGTLSGPGRRPDGPTMATDAVCRAGWQFRTAARAGQPDELRQRRRWRSFWAAAPRPCRFACCRRCRRPNRASDCWH